MKWTEIRYVESPKKWHVPQKSAQPGGSNNNTKETRVCRLKFRSNIRSRQGNEGGSKDFSMRVAGKTGGNLNFKILKIVPHAKLVTVTQTKHGPWHKADPFKTRLGCVSSQFITSLRFSVTDGSLFYEAICACMLG